MNSATPTVPFDQPNSSCNGSMSTPGAARMPAASRIARNATANTIQL